MLLLLPHGSGSIPPATGGLFGGFFPMQGAFRGVLAKTKLSEIRRPASRRSRPPRARRAPPRRRRRWPRRNDKSEFERCRAPGPHTSSKNRGGLFNRHVFLEEVGGGVSPKGAKRKWNNPNWAPLCLDPLSLFPKERLNERGSYTKLQHVASSSGYTNWTWEPS